MGKIEDTLFHDRVELGEGVQKEIFKEYTNFFGGGSPRAAAKKLGLKESAFHAYLRYQSKSVPTEIFYKVAKPLGLNPKKLIKKRTTLRKIRARWLDNFWENNREDALQVARMAGPLGIKAIEKKTGKSREEIMKEVRQSLFDKYPNQNPYQVIANLRIERAKEEDGEDWLTKMIEPMFEALGRKHGKSYQYIIDNLRQKRKVLQQEYAGFNGEKNKFLSTNNSSSGFVTSKETRLGQYPSQPTVSVPKFRTYKTAQEECIERLEKFLQKQKYDNQSRNFDHLRRTVLGAKIFFNKLNKEDNYKIQILGLLHESDPKTLHKKLSKISFPYEDISFASSFLWAIEPRIDDNKDEVEACCKEIEGNTAKAVFMSDKILEGSGAHGVMRACYFAGETAIQEQIPESPKELRSSLVKQLRKESLQRDTFPWLSYRLINYQERWRTKLLGAINQKNGWALDMSERLFISGAEQQDFETTMREFEPQTKQQEEFVNENLKYLNGGKYNHFGDFLSNFL